MDNTECRIALTLDPANTVVQCVILLHTVLQCMTFLVSAYKDFVPEHNRQCQENNGYEVFSNVMNKASNWVARQQGVRFCNVATVMVKSKKSKLFLEVIVCFLVCFMLIRCPCLYSVKK